MKMLKTASPANGKSTRDAQRYRASLSKKNANKRSNSMSQDSGKELHAKSCEPNNKRKRVANHDPEVSQRYVCSSDGVMAACQQGSSPSKYVYHQELGRSSQMDESPISKVKEKEVGGNDIARSSQMNGSPISKVKATKVGANEIARSSQLDGSPVSKVKVKEKKVGANEISRSSQMDGSPSCKLKQKAGAYENGVDASHDHSPLVVQGSSRSPSAGLDNLRFREYLVPVHLTDIQLEQYCSTLITNSALLCSSAKKGNLDYLQGVLGALRKCCDHPYVLDSNLQSFCKERCPSADYLSIGIQASGKLQLLSKLLPEVREKGMRMLIVYKSQTPSSSVKNCLGIGHILDDFICQSFGQESYVHIYTQKNVPPKEKQAAVDLFNDKTSGKFVVLTEYSSIRLICVDVVVLFNSDWNPVNDIRALQKMKLHTENDHLRVLRLYTSCTLEEKALCLARDGSALNGIRPFISMSTCQMLLTWGAAYRFDKLDKLHTRNATESPKSLEDDFFTSLLRELSTLLSSNVDDTLNCSVITKLDEIGEYFAGNIKLHGELELQSMDEIPPHVIWSSLLPGRTPEWRFLPNESKSAKRRMPVWERPPDMSQGGLREISVVHEELPSWYRDKSLIARRSKRVPGCILGFQERLQEIKKRMLQNQDMENLENAREPLDKLYQLEKDSISEQCVEESLSKLNKKLDDRMELGELCHDMDRCWDNLLAKRTLEEEMRLKRIELLKNLPEDSDDAEFNAQCAFIDSGNSNAGPMFESESAAKTLEDDKIYTSPTYIPSPVHIQELSPRERLNMLDGNDPLNDVEISTDNLGNGLSHDVSFNCWNAEDVNSKNDQNQASGGLLSSSLPVSDASCMKENGQSTSNGFTSHDDFEIFHECLPIEEMDVAFGSENEHTYVRSMPGPVDESAIKELDVLSDQIVPDNSDFAPPLSESELGASIMEEDHNNGPGIAVSCKDSELGANILEKDQDCDPIIVAPCSLTMPENQGPIYGVQSSEELAVPSIHVNSDDQQTPQQLCIDEGRQLPAEQLPSTQLPCSEIRVTDESRPSFSHEFVGIIGDCAGNSNGHQPPTLDPLQVELGKILNSATDAMKKHEDTVVLLRAVRDEEIAQISAKYDLLFQNAKNNFMQKKEELKGHYEKINAHMLLAEAWRLACDDNSPIFPLSSLVQSTSMQENAFSPSSQFVNQFSGIISSGQIVRPPYPPSHQNLCNSNAGWRPYDVPLIPTHGFPLSQFNQHPLSFTPSGSSTGYFSQILSSGEYLAPYNFPI